VRRVGLTGGIGSGKSAVAAFWRERGATIVDADALAHAAVAPGTPALAAIAARWPHAVAPDGTLDRAALARIVFADDAQRAQLGAIVHPRVRAAADALEAAAPAGALVVHVVPLLFEGDFWRRCDATVVVTAPEGERIARVRARDGVDEASVVQRMRAQIDPAEARRRATYVIANDADLATLRERANAVYDRLLGD
jgi:dephospho-CoA kinase